MGILLGDCNAKVGREDIFKPKIGNEILHRNSIANGVRIVNFAITKNKFLRARCSRTETFTNTLDHSRWENNQIYHIWTIRRYIRVYSMFDHSADCDTDHHLVLEKLEKAARMLMWRDIISGS